MVDWTPAWPPPTSSSTARTSRPRAARSRACAQLDEAVRQFQAEFPGDEVIVVVDATFGHRIDPSERKAFDEAVAHAELVSPPGRRRRPRRRLPPPGGRAGRRAGAVERLLPGVPRRAPLALRGGAADRREAGARRGVDLHAPQPGARGAEPSRAGGGLVEDRQGRQSGQGRQVGQGRQDRERRASIGGRRRSVVRPPRRAVRGGAVRRGSSAAPRLEARAAKKTDEGRQGRQGHEGRQGRTRRRRRPRPTKAGKSEKAEQVGEGRQEGEEDLEPSTQGRPGTPSTGRRRRQEPDKAPRTLGRGWR